jgi:NAD(P)-dependent dehydrogenase (short-subunit alcohol dehydrogenase family)
MAGLANVVVVTGGTSGLGLRLAEILSGGTQLDVVLTGRSRGATEAVAQSVGARGAVLDLASLASVHAFAAEVTTLTGGQPLHALVCNAGIQVLSRSTTSDGFETTFGVNHIGHVALIEELLQTTGPPRHLILVASGVHDAAQRTGMPAPLEEATARELAFPDQERPQDESPAVEGRRRYATSKLANVRTAFELSRRLAGTTVVTSFDPGLMPGTGLARDAGPLQRAVWATAFRLLLVVPAVQTPRQAARQLAPLVTGTSPVGTGSYVERGRPRRASVAARDTAAQHTLYEDTLTLIASRRAE